MRKSSTRKPYKKTASEIIELLQNTTTLCWILVIMSLFWTSYRNIPWSSALSFQVNDGWCNLGNEGIGEHCFGDFGLPYNNGYLKAEYAEIHPASMNTPLIVLLFKLLMLSPYNLGLFLISLLYLLGVLSIFIHATKNLLKTQRVFFSVFHGLLTIGTLVSIDRSNWVILIAPLSYWAYISWEQGKEKKTLVLLALAGAIKFWGILLVLPLLLEKRFRLAFKTLIFTLVLYLLPLFAVSSSPLTSLKNMFFSITDRNYANLLTHYTTSIFGLLKKIDRGVCKVVESCTQNGYLISDIRSSTILALLVGFILVLLSSAVYLNYHKVPELKYLPIISLAFLFVPEAGGYNLVMISTTSGLFIYWVSREKILPNQKATIATTYLENARLRTAQVIAFSLPPIALPGQLFTPYLVEHRLHLLYVPVLWLCLLLYLFVMKQRLSDKPKNIKEL